MLISGHVSAFSLLSSGQPRTLHNATQAARGKNLCGVPGPFFYIFCLAVWMMK